MLVWHTSNQKISTQPKNIIIFKFKPRASVMHGAFYHFYDIHKDAENGNNYYLCGVTV